MIHRTQSYSLFPYTTLFRSDLAEKDPTVVEIPIGQATGNTILANLGPKIPVHFEIVGSLESDVVHEMKEFGVNAALLDRKSTRLNSSHVAISYAVFCLKKKN